MQDNKENISNITDSLNSLIPLALPYAISFFGISFGLRKIKEFIYEDNLRDIDKKDLVNYLLQNRIFLESLTDEEIEHYYKYFKSLYGFRKNKI